MFFKITWVPQWEIAYVVDINVVPVNPSVIPMCRVLNVHLFLLNLHYSKMTLLKLNYMFNKINKGLQNAGFAFQIINKNMKHRKHGYHYLQFMQLSILVSSMSYIFFLILTSKKVAYNVCRLQIILQYIGI